MAVIYGRGKKGKRGRSLEASIRQWSMCNINERFLRWVIKGKGLGAIQVQFRTQLQIEEPSCFQTMSWPAIILVCFALDCLRKDVPWFCSSYCLWPTWYPNVGIVGYNLCLPAVWVCLNVVKSHTLQKYAQVCASYSLQWTGKQIS